MPRSRLMEIWHVDLDRAPDALAQDFALGDPAGSPLALGVREGAWAAAVSWPGGNKLVRWQGLTA